MVISVDPKIIDTDYVKDGVLYRGYNRTGNVLVESDSDLTELAPLYLPGDMAHTKGWAQVWELHSDGEWEEM